jgi:NDP-sugar pyrophosphorylase family protein
MAIPLSQQGNSVLNRIIVIILCAGEGTRFINFVTEIPKPLIKVVSEKNRTLLEIILFNLYNQGINRFIVITGHLREKLEAHVKHIREINNFTRKELTSLYSEQYKRGPFYSFLKIVEEFSLYSNDTVFMVVPGDTIFKLELLNEIFKSIEVCLKEEINSLLIFYRNIDGSTLKQKYVLSRSISIAKIEDFIPKEKLIQITQTNIHEISDEQEVKQMIPIFLLSYDFIQKISQFEIPDTIRTLREIINYSISKGEFINSIQISNKFDFYDIDYISDLEHFEAIKKKEQ